MKVIIIKKRTLILIIATLLLTLLIGTILLFILKKDNLQTFNPLPNNKEGQFDVTGDGDNDIIEIINEKDKYDVQITSKGRIFLLSSVCNDKLVDYSKNWPIKVYIVNVSRNNRYEILVKGCKDKKPVSYLFGWSSGKFILLNESPVNITGILDSNGKRTPQYLVLNSSNAKSTIKSFMFLDDEIIDTTTNTKELPTIDNVFTFINLIQTKYELEELPNIFSDSIASDNLAILWSLNKENYEYSFQDGFFYDDKFDKKNNFTSTKWRLTFEKYNKSKPTSDKEQLVIILEYTLTNDGFKITSISK